MSSSGQDALGVAQMEAAGATASTGGVATLPFAMSANVSSGPAISAACGPECQAATTPLWTGTSCAFRQASPALWTET